jgi:hypothetical protein
MASLELTPKVSLGQVEQQDFSATANAIAALNKAGYLDPSQFPGVDTLLSLPARDPAALATPPPAQTPPAPNEQQPPSQTTQERNATQPTPPAA